MNLTRSFSRSFFFQSPTDVSRNVCWDLSNNSFLNYSMDLCTILSRGFPKDSFRNFHKDYFRNLCWNSLRNYNEIQKFHRGFLWRLKKTSMVAFSCFLEINPFFSTTFLGIALGFLWRFPGGSSRDFFNFFCRNISLLQELLL